jgi:tRNA threonylcarbamoyladenosine biosynthesis protein TsaE
VSSESQLEKVAGDLLQFAGSQRIFLFYGEMGAGKTTFIKALCRRLGVSEGMSSPTFSIINEYLARDGKKIYHFDFYRIKSEQEAIDAGVEEYFDSGSYCLIEWPEKIINLLPEPGIRVEIRTEGTNRQITFSHE